MNQAFFRPLLLPIALAITCIGSASAGATSLQGTAMYRERIATPPNATFDARLQVMQANSTPDSPLRNTYWKLVSLHGKPIVAHAQQREAHIVFASDDNRLSGSSGCNRMMGVFENKNDQLKINNVAGTRMACREGMEVETQFLKALLTVTRFTIRGEHMDMLDATGDIVAGFNAVALQ